MLCKGSQQQRILPDVKKHLLFKKIQTNIHKNSRRCVQPVFVNLFSYAYCFPLIFLFSIQAYGQAYTYNQVIQKSDSALQGILPKFLLPAAKLYNTPYYLSLLPDEEWLLLEKNESIRGKLQQLSIMYEFMLRQTSCTQYKNLRTLITLHFDSNMQLISHTGVDAIPDFVLNNMPCPFISYPELKEVLRKNNVPDDVRMREVSYNNETKRFEYFIVGDVRQLQDTSGGKTRIELKRIRINAETGDVIENNFGTELKH